MDAIKPQHCSSAGEKVGKFIWSNAVGYDDVFGTLLVFWALHRELFLAEVN